MSNILAISHEIEDENTGAIAEFHVLEYLTIDYKYQSATATINGYINQKAYEKGRSAITSTTLTVHGLPENGDPTRDWVYEQAVAENTGSVFAGAELVYRKTVSQAD